MPALLPTKETPSKITHTVDLRDMGVEEVPLVGHDEHKQAGKALGDHRHDNLYELVMLSTGEQAYEIDGVGTFNIRGGQALLTHPGEAHRNAWSHQGRGHLYWIQFAPPTPRKPWLGMAPSVAKPVNEQLRSHPRALKQVGDHLLADFKKLTEPQGNESGHLLGHLVQRLIFDFLSSPLATDHRVSDTVARALGWIDNSLDGPLPVPALAARLGISASTLTRRFKEEVGTTPADYHLRRRIDKAGEMLGAGKSVTDTAMDLGFCSSQHFATQYRKVTHHSPSEDYRKR